MRLNTYLNFGGNCAEAFRFYEQHLGGKIIMMSTYGEAPVAMAQSAEMKDAVIHARIHIGDTDLFGSDVPPGSQKPIHSAYLTLGVDSSEDAERIHAVLAEGGEVIMPMGETFFAHRFSMLRDRFGVLWMIIHERPMPH